MNAEDNVHPSKQQEKKENERKNNATKIRRFQI
jgi:hypothetical protein